MTAPRDGECGKPGRLYPCTPADAAALDASVRGEFSAKGLKPLHQVSMIGRCPEHAPEGVAPAALFPKPWPCDFWTIELWSAPAEAIRDLEAGS